MILSGEIRLSGDPYGQSVIEIRGYSPDPRSPGYEVAD
jgi:hypothetical protein